MTIEDQARTVTAGALPTGVNTILCSWESVGVVLEGIDGPSRRKTFVHRDGDRYAITRFTGGNLTGHIVLSRAEWSDLHRWSDIG